MPAGRLDLQVVSPGETVFEGEAASLVLPAWDGRVGVLPGHAPFIGLLGAGMLNVDLVGGGSESYFVRRGVVKVVSDRVTVLSEYAAPEAPDDFTPGDAWLAAGEIG